MGVGADSLSEYSRAGRLIMMKKTEDMNRVLQFVTLVADLLWIVICLWITHFLLRNPAPGLHTLWSCFYDPVTIVACSVWTALCVTKRLAGFHRGWYPPAVVAQTIVGVIYVLISSSVTALLEHHTYSERSMLYLAFLLMSGLSAIRYVAHWFVDSHLHVRTKRRVIILGNGRMVCELVKKINRHPELCMEVSGVLFPSDTERDEEQLSFGTETVSLRTLNILGRLQSENIRDLILIDPVPPGAETEQLLSSCREAGVRMHVVPQQYELYLSKARLTEIEDVPLLSLEEHTLPAIRVRVKRSLDLFGAACLLVLCAPFLMFSALFLRWNKGRTIRTELRCGQDGKPFWMYRLNVERNENQLGVFERFLVQFSVTELPQLFNVLKGEMSLVGPRPEAPEQVKHYSMWQRQRLTVKPGLTGLAQVYGFREQHSSEEKAHFDLQYLFHWSLFLDLCLILQTGWTLLLRIVQEHRIVIPSLLKPLPAVNLEIGRICNADSAHSGTD
jgi:lipopolysaccharide/colanic/teichoic acid biosynthesis glycosyltransferase